MTNVTPDLTKAPHGALFLWLSGSNDPVVPLSAGGYSGSMKAFREATQGVWCLSWHPATDDFRFEALSSVLRNNLVAFEGRHKAVLMVFGHHPDDMVTFTDAQGLEFHSLPAHQAFDGLGVLWRKGWTPAYFPVSLESAERWAWLLQS